MSADTHKSNVTLMYKVNLNACGKLQKNLTAKELKSSNFIKG